MKNEEDDWSYFGFSAVLLIVTLRNLDVGIPIKLVELFQSLHDSQRLDKLDSQVPVPFAPFVACKSYARFNLPSLSIFTAT